MLPGFILFAALYGVIDAKNGFPERFADLSEFNKKQNYPSTVRQQCFDSGLIGNVEQCWLGVKKERLDGVLIGDSFANHSASFLDVLAKDAGLYFHDSTAGGHPLLTNMTSEDTFEKDPQFAIDRLAFAMQFEQIVFSANLDSYNDPSHINYQRVLSAIEEIINAGKQLTFIESVASMSSLNLHKLKLVKSGQYIFFDDYLELIPRPTLDEQHIYNEIKRRFPQIRYVNLKDLLCVQGTCATSVNGTIIYRNPNHLNTSGAAMMGEQYLAMFGNPFTAE